MKHRGFTLVELLAVLVLVSAIVLIAVPSIVNYINENKEDISVVTQEIIYSGAKLYVESKPNEYIPEVGKTFCVSLQSIVDANYLSSPILDSVSGEEIDLNTKVILNYVYDTELKYNKYEYSFSENCDS